jgi:hypothetical protein
LQLKSSLLDEVDQGLAGQLRLAHEPACMDELFPSAWRPAPELLLWPTLFADEVRPKHFKLRDAQALDLSATFAIPGKPQDGA